MKYKLQKTLGSWKAGTSATREDWNDKGLPLELLDDDAWFERVGEKRITIWEHELTTGVSEYTFFMGLVFDTSEPIKLTKEQKQTIEAALNGDAPQGWTVDQMRKIWDKAEHMPLDNSVEPFLDYLETLTPEQPDPDFNKPFPGWTGKEIDGMVRDFVSSVASNETEVNAFDLMEDIIGLFTLFPEKKLHEQPREGWTGQEPAEVFTFDDVEGVIFAYLRHIEQQKPSGPKTPSRFIEIWLESRKK